MLDGGVRDRLMVVTARGKLMVGALVGEATATPGCLRTLTAPADALTVDCIRLGRIGVLPLSTRAGTDFSMGGVWTTVGLIADMELLPFLSSANKAAMFGCWTITWTSPPVSCPGVEG